MLKLKPAVKEAIAKIMANEDLFVRNVLSIIDKKGDTVRFMPNRPQRLYEERSRGKRFNYTIKSRKMGISTRIIARRLWKCATQKNRHSILLTQAGDAAHKMITERIKPMLRNAALPLGGIEREDYIFFPATNSRYYAGTAGSKKFGRGSDITDYHLSEFAHWDNPDVLAGVEEACTEHAEGDIETTTNGFNFAQPLWMASKEGKTRYNPIFIPWYADESYQIAGTRLNDLSEEEHRLVEAYNLSHAQLAWRRAKIRDMSSPELFPQEYPANDIEAFISSGRPVFDWISLQRHEGGCSDPRWVGDLRDDGRSVQLIPSARGLLKVWAMPETAHVYMVGADVATGVEDGDYSVAQVIDCGTDEQVAEWHGHIAPDLFADILISLGLYYNGAMLAPEAWPGPGEVTINCLEERGYRNLWRDPVTKKFWETNKHSKQKAVLDLVADVRNLKTGLKSKSLIGEMRSYMYDAKGDPGSTSNMGAALGSHDDRVMAMAIAWYVSRPLAERVNYESPRLRDILTPRSFLGGVTIPQWRGPIAGVRRD